MGHRSIDGPLSRNDQAWGVLVNLPEIFYEDWMIDLGSLGYFKLVYTPIPRLEFIIQKPKTPPSRKALSNSIESRTQGWARSGGFGYFLHRISWILHI